MTTNIYDKRRINGHALIVRGIVIKAVLLFLLMQFAAVVHAVEHPFHKADARCDVFVAAEKSKADTFTGSVHICVTQYSEYLPDALLPADVWNITESYFSRAPPRKSYT